VVAPGGEQSIVEGMELAASQAGLQLEFRTEGLISTLLRDALDEGPPAVLVVASLPATADAVVQARPEIEAARIPVIVLGADLYTEQALHRYLFQTAIPLRWQARVLAHYLVTDRGYDLIRTAGDTGTGAQALLEEGAEPAPTTTPPDAVLMLGRATVAFPGIQQAVSSEALLVSTPIEAGTVTCYPYTWAGWAEPIPRVARFRDRFTEAFGHPPAGFEQEGYDAVSALAEALDRTDGEGGDRLVRELESFREETYSALPIRLGPDDHVFAEESHLGLFALTEPGGAPPGEAVSPVPWRPLMRTFTTNGKRVNLAERDLRVFFPRWRPRRPRPNYWRSELGIVTRPSEDPLH
jgi:hypothetical protein